MPYGTPPVARQLEQARFNRFLATLPPHEFALLAPHLRTIPLERGVMLQDVGEEIEHVYFPHTGMVSLVAVMQSGATVETTAIGRWGVIGASAGLGARSAVARAIVQLPGTAAWISAPHFHAAAAQSTAIRDLIVARRLSATSGSALPCLRATASVASAPSQSPARACMSRPSTIAAPMQRVCWDRGCRRRDPWRMRRRSSLAAT